MQILALLRRNQPRAIDSVFKKVLVTKTLFWLVNKILDSFRLIFFTKLIDLF